MKTIAVDRAELVRLMKRSFSFTNRLVTYVRYKLGAKLALGSEPSPNTRTVDCSGYVRWLLYGATLGQTAMPDGSWNQQAWVREQGFEEVPYSDCARRDGRLRIAFINPRKRKVGHVWLCISASTIESWGGHGAGRRSWDTPVLRNNVSACFVLTDPLP